MQKVRLSAPLAGLLLQVALCSAASIGVAKDEKLSAGPGGRACVQDDKGNLVCGKLVVSPGFPAPPLPPPMPMIMPLDLFMPPVMPPKFHEVRDHSGEVKMLLPWDLFSLPSILDDISDGSYSFPLDEIIRDMGKAKPSCSPVPGQVMADGKLTMDCFMDGDDLPGPISMHVTYDLADLPDDFDIKDIISGRGLDMLLPPPLWQMLTDSMAMPMPSQVPLIAPPKMASAPVQQTQKPEKTDKPKGPNPDKLVDPFHPSMNEIRSSFDAMLGALNRDAMNRPMDRPTVPSGTHVIDVSVLGGLPPNDKKTKN